MTMPPVWCRTAFGLDVIREMQVVTSGGQAEYGRALGGYINFRLEEWNQSASWKCLWVLRNHV